MTAAKSKLAFLLLLALLGGCEAYENLGGGPRASGEIIAPSNADSGKVFSCIENTTLALHKSKAFWLANINERNLATGIMETGNFSETNILGFRTRTHFDSGTKKVKIQLKGIGLYYKDLGVDAAMIEFKSGLQDCLTASTLG